MSATPSRVERSGLSSSDQGRVESITGGISAANAPAARRHLPNVDPIFTWVRLAQRIPVRDQDRTSPSGRTAHRRNDLQRFRCRRKASSRTEARSGNLRPVHKPTWVKPMRAPRDIELGGVLIDPFVRCLFLALVILIAIRFTRRPPPIEIDVRQSSPRGSGPLRLHPRFPCGLLALSAQPEGGQMGFLDLSASIVCD